MSFVSLYTAFSGLQAAQAGMDTSSHNVANAATPGYTRQRVEQSTRLPGQLPFGPVGTGVSITDITRSRDLLLDTRARAAIAGASHFQTLGGLLSGIETPLAEPENGVTSALGGLWSAFEELSLNPPDTAARYHVIHSLETVAARVRAIADAWQSTASSAEADILNAVDETNALFQEIADLNAAIVEAASSGNTPNDLLDKRDIAIDRLTELAAVRVSITDSGTARVSLDGLAVVHDNFASQISFDTGTGQLLHSTGTAIDAGGSLGAFQNFIATVLPGHQADLDAFAEDLAAALNAQHASGFTPAGAAGTDLMTYTPGAAALTLTVAVTDPDELAVASSGPPVPEYDGLNAEALAGLRFSLSASGGTITIDDAMNQIVGGVGGATAGAFTEAQAQSAISSAAQSARAQMHGVSVDEEMVNLLTYQRAYEAAARVMTAIDQNLDTLINRTGVVGR